MKTLSDALFEAVQESDISKQDLADQSYLSQGYLTSILWKGSKEPDLSDVRNICRVIKRDPEEFSDFLPAVKKQRSKPVRKDIRYPKLKSASSGTKLQKAEGRPCVFPFPPCGKPAETAHYTGELQSMFGKGLGQKVDHLFVADLCREHHKYFDEPTEKKSWKKSYEFLICILLTMKRKLLEGRIELR